jgi:hypothetical protein
MRSRWTGAAGIAAFILSALPSVARAQDAPASGAAPEASSAPDAGERDGGWAPLTRFTFFWENDGAWPKPRSNSDEHYTNGIKLDFAWQPEWADRWLDWMPLTDQFGPAPETAFGLSVQQLMFTPEDIEAKDVVPDDRPYAGLLTFAAYWQRSGQLTDHLAMLDHIELDAGVVGSWSGAGDLQEFVHHTWPDEIDPEGWSNQLPNTAAIDLTLRRRWRFSTEENADHVALQFIPSVGGTVGTVYRQLEADALVRVGWNLPNDFGPTRLADVNAATGGWSDAFGFYIYGRLGGRAVQHNMFLDGPDFASATHTVDSEPLVGEMQFGVVVLLWHHLEIGYAQTFMTDEFEGQRDADAYGAITLGYRMAF